jgi:hypothetical protein
MAVPAFAALPDGTKAPDFSTEASLAGKAFKFSLALFLPGRFHSGLHGGSPRFR